MSSTLPEKVRKLNRMLSDSTSGYVSFDELSDLIGKLLDSSVYVMSRKGKVLAATKLTEPKIEVLKEDDAVKLTPELNDNLLEIGEMQENVCGEAVKKIYGRDYQDADQYHVIVPVIIGNKRIATVVLMRKDAPYSEEDLAIVEYGATIIGLEVSRGIALEEEADNRERNAVDMALETLSYSEIDAVVKIFSELDGDEGILVASKVADKFNITRSVIVNALRKLESAGVIESRSLGMKGTRIKITNEFLREEIDKIDI